MGVGKRTKPMGDGCCQFSTVGRSCFGGAGKTPTMQKVWLTALRHLIAFAIEQGDCKTDPTIGIKTARPPESSGHVTWGNEQIAQYRERHANGTMARLAMELMLNIAARRHDAH